jgi:hypothetical protein
MEHGVICINDVVVPREYWRRVKPKAVTDKGIPVVVTLHIAPKGGLGGGGSGSTTKTVLTIVAAIAIVVATAFIGAGGLAAVLPGVFAAATFGAGTLGAALAAAAVATLGSLLLNSLSPPPVKANTAFGGDRPDESAFADGNLVSPGGIIPRVLGTFRIFPPFLAQPLVDIVEGVEVVEAIYGLSGPHLLEDIQIDGIALSDQADVESEIKLGFPTDSQVAMVTRYANTSNPQAELSQHAMKADDKTRLLHFNTNPDQDVPKWFTFVTRDDPDELWIQLIWPQGIIDGDQNTIDLNIPYRLRMRPVGTTTWINLPEIHIHGRKAEVIRKYIKLIWSSNVSDVPTAEVSTKDTFIRYYHTVPQQTFGRPVPAGGWLADSHFINSGTITDVKNVRLHADGAKIYLYNSTFPTGLRWEVGIIRGTSFDQGDFTPATYIYNSPFVGTNEIYDFYSYWYDTADARLPRELDAVNDKCIVLRMSTVHNEPPVTGIGSGLAIVALRATSRQVNKVSVLASGLVPTWNGSIWTGLNPTSNPAPHFRDVLTGNLNTDPLPTTLLDQAGILEWQDWCDLMGHECNAIIEGRSVYEVLTLLASCGRARPLTSDIWGVIVDQARISETPVTIFSPRNSNGFAFEKLLPIRSQAFRVKFRNIDKEYEEDEIIIEDPDIPVGTAERFEDVSYDGIVYEDAVRDRMLFDILQTKLRNITYSLDTDIESLVCRRGDLVGVSHEIIEPSAGYGRIRTINISGGLVQNIVLDNIVSLGSSTSFFALTSVFIEPDIFSTGMVMGVSIRMSNGVILTKKISAASIGDTDTLIFDVPFALPAAFEVECLAVVGPVDLEYGRYIVADITPSSDLTAKLTLIDEAPGLHVGEIGQPWDDGLYWDDDYGWSVF